MKAIFLPALLCICNSGISFAQNPAFPEPTDAASARQLLARASQLFDSSQYLAAEQLAESAYIFFHNPPDAYSEDLAEAAFLTGRAAFKLEKFGGARPLFEEAQSIWEKLYPDGSLLTAKALHFAGLCYFYRSKAEEARINCLKAYELRKKLLPPMHCELSVSLRVLGNIYVELGEYATGKDHYKEALNIAEQCAGKKSTLAADVLANLGIAYLRLGDFQTAIATEEQALQIRQDILPPSHSDIGDCYINLGMIYRTLHQYDEAFFYYEKTLEIRRKNEVVDLTDIAFTYSEIGKYYLAQKDYKKAQEYFEAENNLMIESNATQESSYVYTCADLGSLYQSLKNYPAAIEWYEKMLALHRKSFTNINSSRASALTRLGSARLANGDYEIALSQFQEAKKIWADLFGEDNFMPSRASGGIANVYRKWYNHTLREDLMEKSRQHYRMAENGIAQQMRLENSVEGQKRLLVEALPVFERSMGMELLFFKKTNDPAALEKAWQLSEAMHSFLLFSSTQEANALHFAGIPDEELSRDSLLRAQTTSLEKKRRSLIESKGLNLSDSLVLDLSLQISAKKVESMQMQASFEKRYPDYFRLKYDLKTTSLSETQQSLTPQQTLLEYFIGDSAIFVFVLQREGSQIVELPRNFPLAEWVKAFHEGVSGYHTAGTTQNTKPSYQKSVLQYADAAQNLYKKLLQPIARLLTPEIIVVPGDGIASLPFEALLSAAPKDLSNFKTYPFLLRSHSFQYAYSATMLHQMIARRHPQMTKGGLLAFAPFFEEDTTSVAMRVQREGNIRLGFSALPFSGEEVYRAQYRFGSPSSVLIGKLATKQKFLDLAAQHKILHLATHGKANHRAGEFSFLAFASGDANQENGLLSVGELYNLPLNADLVILSACETGIGEQQRGEGVVSLARAFAYAGAKSILASLWSVNDKSTMLVMDNFYSELNSGKPKHVALSNAKLRYLEENPGQAHPFFWAGFVGVGDLGVIKK